jgi:hypothetical protein
MTNHDSGSKGLLFPMGVSVFGIIVLFLWGLWTWPQSQFEDGAIGVFGDSFGPIIGFFSILAIVFALRSVQLQRQELALQRQELKETREVLREQREAQREQAESLKEANALQTHANELTAKTLQENQEREKRQREQEKRDVAFHFIRLLNAPECSRARLEIHLTLPSYCKENPRRVYEIASLRTGPVEQKYAAAVHSFVNLLQEVALAVQREQADEDILFAAVSQHVVYGWEDLKEYAEVARKHWNDSSLYSALEDVATKWRKRIKELRALTKSPGTD